MVKIGKEEIINILEGKGYDISNQALEYIDALGRENDSDLVTEFVEWYESYYQKNIGGQDVFNFIAQRKGYQLKKEKQLPRDR